MTSPTDHNPQVLVLNVGSSSLKYQLFNARNYELVAGGLAEKVGSKDSFMVHGSRGTTHEIQQSLANHHEALAAIIEVFDAHGPKINVNSLVAIGHRVVNGGRFSGPVVINTAVERSIEDLIPLAPLHNPPALATIRAARELFTDTPQVAVFDTAFHQTMPPEAYNYAIDQELADEYNIRRYGFHGISYAYVAHEAAGFIGQPLDELNMIVLHLGSGCSATAIQNGKSIDTSMGLTPLEGLAMGSRSGDIDPGVIFYLYRSAGMSLDEIDELLNKRSGLMGLSGGIADVRNLLELSSGGDERAKLALDVFCRRVKKYIGAYMALLGRVDAIVFTGGIGERGYKIRQQIMDNLGNLGITIDEKLNYGEIKQPKRISTSNSKIAVLVIPTNEELEIARQVIEVVN